MSHIDANMIVIVSGLPRSGTSMMMRMIEAGGVPALTDNIRTADEDNPRGYYEFEPVKKTKEDASWLTDAPGKVVKMVYRLLYDLPTDRTYHVVFMRRNLQEVIASQDKMLQRLGRETGQMPEEKLMKLFQQQLGEFDDWAAQQQHIRLVDISYNETVTDPAPTVTRVNEFLGGNLDVAAMRAVVEPQLHRQRKTKPAP